MKFSRRNTLKSEHAAKETLMSQFIPYEGHIDERTVITKDNELLQVIKLQGYAFETADDEDVDMKKNIRNTLFKSIAQPEYSMWFHTVRRRNVVTCGGEFSGTFASYLNEEWEKKHVGDDAFVNELYITILLTPSSSTGAAEGVVKAVNKMAADKTQRIIELQKHINDIHEITTRLLGTLKNYKPQILGVRETDEGAFSEVLEFFAMIINCGEYAPVLIPTNHASKMLASQRLYFGRRAIEVRSPFGKSRFAGIVSIQQYANFTSAGLLDVFLQMPFEIIITQTYKFANRAKAINSISLKKQRMESSGDRAITLLAELTDALDMASSGHIAFGEHSLMVMAKANTIDELDANLSLCYGELVNIGIMPSREEFNLQAGYWSQVPGNFGYIARGSQINTLNLAGFVSLHNYPTGKREKNHWGPALTILDTTSGTPYYFNFHVRDVGHSMIIGPTGAGKTVMMNFLMAQAQKYDVRMFFFDKDRGAEIFLRAVGGKYSVIDPSKDSGFNPLHLPDAAENRTFLAEWFRALCLATFDQQISPEEGDLIAEAVSGNYKMDKEKRILRNVAPFLGLEGPGTLASRMRIWHSGETHSGLFDNPIDNVDFTVAKTFGFEMAKVLADGLSINSVLLYLFHKINLSLDGSPTVIVLDEAWALIDNPIFAPKIKDWLKVLRKLNAMVVFATQSVEDISNSSISDTLVQQTATQIYLPNNKATKVYREVFMLSQREFALIKTTDPGTRYFLVKQNEDSVVARIDLSGMDDIINVLSGRADTVLLLDKIREEVGDNPDDWLEIFYRRVKEI